FEWAWGAWSAPGLILLTCLGQAPRRVFLIGYCAGLGQYLLSLDWLLLIPVPLYALAAWIGVCGFLAFYTAIWSWVCCQFFPINLTSAASGLTTRQLWDRVLSVNWAKRALWAAGCAAAWVAMEM